MKIILLDFWGGSSAERALVTKAAKLVTYVTKEPDFQNLFLAEKCTETMGLDQVDIVNLISSLEEDTNINIYNRWWSKVVGYTQLHGNTISLNRKYLRGIIGVASNLGHEVLHQQGFTHDKSWHSSVPYTFNRVFEKTCGLVDLKDYL